VWQDIVRIDVAIKKCTFHKNETILASMKRAKDGNGRLHLLGLVRTLSSTLFVLLT
jgi:2,3-bisphosphoglycerate-independent phosphoglycerate mutase